jgi:hypothetical protein
MGAFCAFVPTDARRGRRAGPVLALLILAAACGGSAKRNPPNVGAAHAAIQHVVRVDPASISALEATKTLTMALATGDTTGVHAVIDGFHVATGCELRYGYAMWSKVTARNADQLVTEQVAKVRLMPTPPYYDVAAWHEPVQVHATVTGPDGSLKPASEIGVVAAVYCA